MLWRGSHGPLEGTTVCSEASLPRISHCRGGHEACLTSKIIGHFFSKLAAKCRIAVCMCRTGEVWLRRRGHAGQRFRSRCGRKDGRMLDTRRNTRMNKSSLEYHLHLQKERRLASWTTGPKHTKKKELRVGEVDGD